MSFQPHYGEIVEPGSLTIRQAINYKGKDWGRLVSTGKNFRKAIPGMAGPVIAVICMYPIFKNLLRSRFEGEDGKGGSILNVTTKYDTNDMEYTREFMKMRFMQESIFQMDGKRSEIEQNLKKEGVKLPEINLRYDVKKEAPHHKYF